MSEPFVGEIKMFAGNFAPRNWAFCDGQMLPISQNDALFSLLGTIYGGDGRTTFGLPDLRGRVPVHKGNGLNLGQKSGSESVTLTANQIPAHNHHLQASADHADQASPANTVTARSARVDAYAEGPATVNLNSAAVSSFGGGQGHNNLQPYLCVNFIIALYGIYPSRQ